MSELQEHLRFFAVVISFWVSLYAIPFLIRKGWADAENKTKKVCDICFRDIKKWNEIVKKAEEKQK